MDHDRPDTATLRATARPRTRAEDIRPLSERIEEDTRLLPTATQGHELACYASYLSTDFVIEGDTNVLARWARRGVVAPTLDLRYEQLTYQPATKTFSFLLFLILFVYLFLFCDVQNANPASRTTTNKIFDVNPSRSPDQVRAATGRSPSKNHAVCHAEKENEFFCFVARHTKALRHDVSSFYYEGPTVHANGEESEGPKLTRQLKIALVMGIHSHETA